MNGRIRFEIRKVFACKLQREMLTRIEGQPKRDAGPIGHRIRRLVG